MASELSKDACETIVYERDFQHHDISAALKIVERFIKQKKRILVGGMAIDMSLRSKGSALYPDNKFPDYDMYSPEFHRDAYELGDILAKQFTGVSVIRAYHISTMKVRLNFQELADITYIPQEIYQKLPVLEHKGFRFIHPHFQLADQHRALSLPYEKPPQETIFGRWKKDLERYDLLTEYFPVEPSKKNIALRDTAIKVPIGLLKDNCLAGVAAAIYWQRLAERHGRPAKVSFGTLEYSDAQLSCVIPQELCVQILTDDYKSTAQKIKEVPRFRAAILDKVRRRVVYNNVELLDNRGNLIGAAPVDRELYGTPDFMVVNIQDIMCSMMCEALLYESDTALQIYAEMAACVAYAAEKYAAAADEPDIAATYEQFLPTVEVYGTHNIYDSYTLQIDLLENMVLKQERRYVVPRDAYPTAEKPVDRQLFEFDPTTVDLYNQTGEYVEEFDWHLKKTKEMNIT